MPNIVINEYDKTKPGARSYENFSVVIPGAVAADKLTDFNAAADENGILECDNITKFINLVGKVKNIVEGAKAAEPEDVKPKGSEVSVYKKAYSAEEFYTKYFDTLYKKDSETAVTKAGYLCFEENTNNWIKLKRVVAEDWSADAEFYRVLPGNEGNDENGLAHRGNQIAYELISAGYTVLYKNLTKVAELNDANFWDCLKDRATYDFRYITTGGYINTEAYAKICNVATFVNTHIDTAISENGRGDCIALLDIDESSIKETDKKTVSNLATKIGRIAASYTGANKYSAIFFPEVVYNMGDDVVYQNKQFPASFHYLVCAAKARENAYAEWYAVAGYTRGISDYSIDKTTFKVGEVLINALEPRSKTDIVDKAVNVVANIRGTYYLWGNRTAEALDGNNLTAKHFLNIRQLCCTLKKAIYVACRRFTFDPNSNTLWVNFYNTISPVLERMKADQGIADYKIIKVADSSKALLKARVRIVPIEAVEDFEIDITLENSISGAVVGEEENA